MSKRACLSLWLLLAACSASPRAVPEHTTSIALPSTASASAAPAPAAPASLASGAWEGAPCDSRKYLRRLTFEPDHTFTAVDLVAPCPRGAACVWSGIILWNGTWDQRSDHLVLAADPSTRLPERVPSRLLVSTDCLVEVDDTSCKYRRGGD